MKEELVQKFVNNLSLLELGRLQEIVTAKLQVMQYIAIGRGSVVSFKDRNGAVRMMTIDRVNGKTYGGVELNTKRSWRVSKALCTPVQDYRPPATTKPAKPVEPHVSSSGVAW